MSCRKLWTLLTLLALTMLPLAGCGGGGGTSAATKDGYKLTVSGDVAGSKTTLKTVFATTDLGTITVINAQDGATLATGPIGSDGKFSNLAITLPTAKAILVFKADVSLAGSPFRSIVPIDLSNPPAAGISASNGVNIEISQKSTDIAKTVSAMLGLTGFLGDAGSTLADSPLAADKKTFTAVAALVVDNGGQVLAYNTGGLMLNGSLSNGALLPAVDAGTLSVADLNNIALDGKVLSAFIPAKNPIVNFQVVNKATGKGIKGMKTFALHIAKLMPEVDNSNSYWVNYLSKGLPTSAMPALVARGTTSPVIAATNPTADAADLYDSKGNFVAKGYTIIDHGDGTYTATFGSDITANVNAPYQPTLTHRIGISVRNVNVPGGYAGPIDPLTGAVQAVFTSPNVANLIYDFTPDTGAALADAAGKRIFARDIVTAAACAQCHYKLALSVPNNFLSGHTGSRTDTKLCVMCHTSQVAEGEGEFVTFIHRIHMGEVLNEGGSFKPIAATSLMTYGEQTYPQDIRNCTMCHKGADVDNWKAKPSKKACGSCHNASDLTAHKGGQASDKSCASCHTGAISAVEISAAHLAVQSPDPASPEMGGTNTHTYAGYLPAAGAVVPGAAVFTWDVKSVALVNQHPTITFKFKKNGSDVVFNTYAAGSVTEMIPGFVGSPSAYFAYAVPQDGIAKPADFNATASTYIKNAWNGSATGTKLATITAAPDASGYYVLTIDSATVPATATMFTGGIGYSYGSSSTPLTQIDLSAYPYTASTNVGGLMTVVPNVWKIGAGFTTRRAIVSNAKCNACHAALGIAPTFHSGQRNDAPTCSFCHTVNKVNAGWAVNAKDVVHAIHAAGKRTNKFSWEVSAGAQYWGVTYPGLLRNCEQCHVAGTYDFSAAASSSAVPNLLMSSVAQGLTPATISSITSGAEAVPGTYYSPFVTAGADYGKAFSATAASQDVTYSNNLVISPITSACFSCHDTKLAQAHMAQFGGSIYEARSTALGKSETCLVCHGTAQNNLNSTVPTIKAVHRWW